MTEQLAIMRNVGYGLRDTNRPCLWFDAYISEHGVALHLLFGEDVDKAIYDAKVYDIKSLNGYPCWVEIDDNIMRFLRVWKHD